MLLLYPDLYVIFYLFSYHNPVCRTDFSAFQKHFFDLFLQPGHRWQLIVLYIRQNLEQPFQIAFILQILFYNPESLLKG